LHDYARAGNIPGLLAAAVLFVAAVVTFAGINATVKLNEMGARTSEVTPELLNLAFPVAGLQWPRVLAVSSAGSADELLSSAKLSRSRPGLGPHRPG
jgi:hypothetical protein